MPSKEVQKEYLESQIKRILEKKFSTENEIEFNEVLLKKATEKEEKRELEDLIEKQNKDIEGYNEYLSVLYEFLGESREMPVEDKIEILNKKLLEVEKANFRGQIGKELQSRRKPENKDEERAIEDEIEAINNAIELNELLYNLAEKKLKEL